MHNTWKIRKISRFLYGWKKLGIFLGHVPCYFHHAVVCGMQWHPEHTEWRHAIIYFIVNTFPELLLFEEEGGK